MSRFLRWSVLGLAVGALGCSGVSVEKDAERAAQQGDWDAAVMHYLELVQEEPNDLSHRGALLRAKVKASQMHFDAG